MAAAPYPEQRTERPPRGLYTLGIIAAGLSILIPLLALVGIGLGLTLRSQGWRREGTILAGASAAIGIAGALIWYFFAYR